jgi:hypothetical protein
VTVGVDELRQKAKRYELSALAAREREEHDLALGYSAVAIALLEVAAMLEDPNEEDGL